MRSVLAVICVFEAVLIGLAIPVALTMTDISGAAIGVVGGVLFGLCLLTAGLVRKPVGVWLGTLIQVAIFGLGFVVPVLFALGLVFGGLWTWALIAERRLTSTA